MISLLNAGGASYGVAERAQPKFKQSAFTGVQTLSRDTVSFSGAGMSTSQWDLKKAHGYLLHIIDRSPVQKAKRQEARERYEKATTTTEQSKAIIETVRWMSSVGGFFRSEHADKVRTVLAAEEEHLNFVMADLCKALGYSDPFKPVHTDVGWVIPPC